MNLATEIANKSTARNLVAVILNPASCQDVYLTKTRIENFLLSHGLESIFFYTHETQPASVYAKIALGLGAKIIVAGGGDGTVMETANALVGENVPLGILPLGTANLLALNLRIPTSFDEALELIVAGRDRAIDLVKIDGGVHYFAIMGGIGFDAKVMDDTDRSLKQKFGRLAYIWTAVNNLQGDLFDATITLDAGTAINVSAKSILIANMGFLGANINAFPTAIPDDGVMQIGVLKASSPLEFARLVASAVIVGAPEKDPTFDIYDCKSLKVELPAQQLFEYDGDIVGEITSLTAEIAPHALIVRTP